MLLSFRFENFRSFKEEQELSMVAGRGKEKSEVLIHSPGVDEGILPISAIYGANASGKSNILRAFRFVVGAVRFSHSQWEPDGGVPSEPFAGSDPHLPSSFTVDFLDRDIRYQYSFSVNDELVLEERLYAYPKAKRQKWFARKAGKPISFGEKLTGDNRVIEKLTRPNSLFLSAAAQNNHKMLSPVYRWFSESITTKFGHRLEWQKRAFFENPENRRLVVRLLTSADLGIADLILERKSMEDVTTNSLVEMLEVLRPVHFVHRFGDVNAVFKEDQESAGTIAYLALLEPVITSIREGGILCVDELDSSLHPNLALQLIRLFNDKASNPKGAQFIFNTQSANLLSSEELRRDETWFTEKSLDGISRLYSLDDFEPREEENLETGYLQGRFGAVPFMNLRKLHTALSTPDEAA